MLVSVPCAFGQVDMSKYEDVIDRWYDEGHRVSYFQYLHGKVQDAMGYDCGVCLNSEVFYRDDTLHEGIYDIKVEGYENPCKAFIWKSKYKHDKCLVVDPTDKEDLEYAQQCYDIKVDRL